MTIGPSPLALSFTSGSLSHSASEHSDAMLLWVVELESLRELSALPLTGGGGGKLSSSGPAGRGPRPEGACCCCWGCGGSWKEIESVNFFLVRHGICKAYKTKGLWYIVCNTTRDTFGILTCVCGGICTCIGCGCMGGCCCCCCTPGTPWMMGCGSGPPL